MTTTARQSLRALLRRRRAAIDPAARAANDARIAGHLDDWLAQIRGQVLAVYWPLPGEPDLRDWYPRAAGQVSLCLPVVRAVAAPLEFRRWVPGQPLAPDAMNIPAPAAAGLLQPDAILAPFVGIDLAGYRLGSGGGYFDRTVANMTDRPILIGVGYACCEIESIDPAPHDIPMDRVVTELGLRDAAAPVNNS